MSDEIDALVRYIVSCHPELKVASARLHNTDGQNNDVLFVNESLVFRFPRTDKVAGSFHSQIIALEQLAQRLPLPIPVPLYKNLDATHVSRIFFGYPRLTGESMQAETLAALEAPVHNRIADQLAQFLKALHSTTAHDIGVNLPLRDTRDEWEKMFEDFRRHLFSHMRPDAQDDVTQTFKNALNSPNQFDYRPALRHGDFGGTNILIDPANGNVTGILDFDDLGWGDPAVDAGAIATTGTAFFERMCETYPEMANHRRRAAFISSTYALQEALFGVLAGDDEAFESGIANYR